MCFTKTFSEAQKEAIRAAEAVGSDKIVPRSHHATLTELQEWCRGSHAGALETIEMRITAEDAGKKFAGMDLRTYRDRHTHLRDAIEEFAKELGLPEKFWL